jgi:Flp pilus assembly protein TadG
MMLGQRIVKIIENESGAILVEFAIIFPIFLLFVIGGIDVIVAMIGLSWLTFAVQAGSTCGAIHAPLCTTLTATTTYATNAANLTGAVFTAKQLPCGIEVAGSWTYVSMILPYNFPWSTSACYPVAP